jgi:endo-1,3-1,4-beta-glycanase ExoK
MLGFLWFLLGVTASATVVQAQSEIGGSFVERFERLDRGKWYVSDGWRNGEHQACVWSARNIKLEPGALALSLTRHEGADNRFACAEVQTNRKYGHGMYEVRMRPAASPGLVTAFFTYTGAPHGSRHDEIDFEFLGKDRAAVQLNYFAAGQGKNEKIVKFAFDATASMNDYAFEWLPDSLRWFVNGELVHEVMREPGQPFPEEPSKIILSIWNGQGRNMEQWLGRFPEPDGALAATYEYVAFTEAGKPCQFPESIVCKRSPEPPKQ